VLCAFLQCSYGPCVDGSGLSRVAGTVQRWSVQPCVRPLNAARMAAGQNALRGSGPGQKHAFSDALAHVGCPDHRIDRSAFRAVSPLQPSHHAVAGAISFAYRVPISPARSAPCSARPWPSSPRPCAPACSQVRLRQLWWAGARAAWPAMADAWCHGSLRT